LLVAAELIFSFCKGETSIFVQQVGVSTSAVQSYNSHAGSNIGSHRLVNPHGVKSTERLSHVHCRWFDLHRGCVWDCKTAIVDCDVLVSAVAALTETLFVAITLVDKDGFEVAW